MLGEDGAGGANGEHVTPSGTRRMRPKAYKCGTCSSLGHNAKTCPQRSQPSGAGADGLLQGGGEHAVAVANGSMGVAATGDQQDALHMGVLQSQLAQGEQLIASAGQRGARVPRRDMPPRLEKSIELAKKRVLASEAIVLQATTPEELEQAVAGLENSVLLLERISGCASRCFELFAQWRRDSEVLEGYPMAVKRKKTNPAPASASAPLAQEVPAELHQDAEVLHTTAQ
mmetsp:Transcript_7570/g.16102  ORF Transcript_7570/g.16102 Transcript_7570/m.16102 type:complete len:229 (+) Transcript_7570:32-718(+)